MGFARSLRCRECGTEYPLDARYVCTECFGPLEVTYDLDALRRVLTRDRIQNGPRSLWRYRDLLPVADGPAVDLHAGFTPLIKADNLGRKLGLRNLYIKNDAVNPTYSFKDRPVAVAASKALEFGFDTLACASTGNLAASVAAHAARAGLNCFVFIPADLEAGKVLNMAVYGATLVPVRGSYDQVNRLCTELADRHGWAFVNINLRPYYAEGSKTLGFEVAEQLGWQAPDACIVPVASGALFTKVAKGFDELAAVGLIEARPIRMYAAQAAGSGPVADAYARRSLEVRPVKPNTIAKSLAIGDPADGYYVLKLIYETGGAAVGVPDAEVVAGIKLLAETEGIFTETAGGVTVATLRRLAEGGAFRPEEVVVAFITGNGLKTQEAVANTLSIPNAIEPTVAAFEAAFGRTLSAVSARK